MITPQEAYDICLKNVPNLIDNGLFGVSPDYFIISNARKGDFGGDIYKVDKNTGAFSEYDWIEDGKYLSTMSDEELDSLPKYEVRNRRVYEA